VSVELIDELEAGELAIEFEGEEPEVLLEWALERFSPRIALSTAFQVDGCVLLDMCARIDPEIRVLSVDTGRLPQETFDLIEALRERYPQMQLELLAPDAPPDKIPPLLQGKGQIGGRPTAYVCHDYTCSQPVTDAAKLRDLLEQA